MMGKYIVIITFIVLSGCSAKPSVVQHASKYSGYGKNEVFVVSHGWHTGLVIPSKAIYNSIPALKDRFGNIHNIEFGWGDKGFYQAKEITSGLTLRAIFWPTESVVHAVGVPQSVYQYFSNREMKRVCLNDKELSFLVEYISNSFYKNDKGEVTELKSGIYGDSQFYKGVGDYYLMNTCNKWTAKGLKSVGMDVFPTFKLTAGSIMSYLDENNNALTRGFSGCQNAPLVPRSTFWPR